MSILVDIFWFDFDTHEKKHFDYVDSTYVIRYLQSTIYLYLLISYLVRHLSIIVTHVIKCFVSFCGFFQLVIWVLAVFYLL